jgi:hypothetical protein
MKKEYAYCIFVVKNRFCNYNIEEFIRFLFHQIKIGCFICALVIRQFIVIFYLTQKCAHLSRPIRQLNDLFANLYNYGEKIQNPYFHFA